ncbi:MAG TPA: heavy metal translocating P-type ATPase, partial [Aeromonadales bacterium]|nr:heavy metal translocating P-type ATPase [Aeromonadales bacterium]
DMLVRIKPGERIPLDGEIVKGQSSVDQSPITGESIPVEKTPGDKVFAGTINQTGSFDFKVTALASQSTLARIIKAVEQAQSKRAPTQRFVDKFAKVYTPAVFILALLVSVLPPLLWGEPWGDWFYKSLVLLVIACPCALVISTPVTVVSGLAAAARRGILVKGGVYLENGHTIEMLALDKTGTITSGKPEVTDVIDLDNDPKNSNLNIIYSLANRSDHPVSMAISNYIKSQPKLDLGLQEVDDFSALTGRGIKGKVKKQLYYLGNHRLLKELGLGNPELEEILNTLEQEGKTVVILATEEKPLLLVAVADTVKESSRQAIAELLNMGIRTLMLTGDNNKTAEAIASNVGLKEFRGELLPEDKLNFISEALTQHKSVAMVGDGINDAPALARASIGFAMGAAGTDTAIETADVALMDDDLGKIAQFIKLSRKTSSLLKQNITIALGIKVVFMVLAFMGIATLWMAVFADMGASLIVVANGLRLLKFKG